MLNRLFRKSEDRTASSRSSAGKRRVPDGVRVYAIGDIHGRNDLLKQLLAQIVEDHNARGEADAHIIFLGDLVDRGPDSRGVIDTAMQFREHGGTVRFIAGNHEEVMLSAVANPSGKTMRFFYRIGGRETMISYGVDPAKMDDMLMEELAEAFAPLVPQEHIDFLESFEDQVRIGDYLFVHAGIKPGVPLDQQKPEHLRWIREEFLDFDRDMGFTVVHGHSISENVDETRTRIGIDTGAFASGKLTALALEGNQRWYLHTDGPAHKTRYS